MTKDQIRELRRLSLTRPLTRAEKRKLKALHRTVEWHAHGSPPIWHLTTEWSRSGTEARYDPICGVQDPETSVDPDGREKCRHCIAREGVEDA